MRRDVQPHVIDQPFVPRRRVQRRRRLRAAAIRSAAPPSRRSAARKVSSAATSICAPRASSAPAPVAPRRRRGRRHDDDRPGLGCREQRAVGGVRSRRSKTTRVSGRSRYAPRAVSSGIVGQDRADADADRVDLGADAVRVAVGGAPTSARCARPGAAAIRPSRLVAAFRMTNGRPSPHQREETADSARRASLAPQPDVDRARRASRRNAKPRAAAPAGFGSSIAATTRAMPAATMRLTHGPVRPVWQHGSSVQYSVAPRAARAGFGRARALRRAARRRARWNPCPTTTPSGGHDDRADERIRAGASARRAPRETARAPCSRVVMIASSLYHFSSNRPSTYSSAENGTRSSMPSPTPT